MPYSKDDLSLEALALKAECANLRAELKASRAETDRLVQGVTITANAEVQKLFDGLRVDLAAARSECDQLKERLRATDVAMVEALRAVRERDVAQAHNVKLLEAISQWKCTVCSGRGKVYGNCTDPRCGESYWDHVCGADDLVRCDTCAGSGLHPTATEAIRAK